MAAIEHLAGRLVDGVQRCIRCDAVLTDYRVAEVRLDAPESGRAGWTEGARVVIEGRSMWVANPAHAFGGQTAAPACRAVRRG